MNTTSNHEENTNTPGLKMNMSPASAREKNMNTNSEWKLKREEVYVENHLGKEAIFVRILWTRIWKDPETHFFERRRALDACLWLRRLSTIKWYRFRVPAQRLVQIIDNDIGATRNRENMPLKELLHHDKERDAE